MHKYTLLTLLLLFSTAALLAQKPKPKASSNATAQKSKTPARVNVTTEEANRIPRPLGSGGWSSGDRVMFLNNCMFGSKKERAAAFGYCSCLLQRLESRYPTAVDARNVKQDSMTVWAKQCLGREEKALSWDDATRKVFLDNCRETTLKMAGATPALAASYCSCMLKKVEAAYPNPKDASHLDQEKVKAWATDCRKQ